MEKQLSTEQAVHDPVIYNQYVKEVTSEPQWKGKAPSFREWYEQSYYIKNKRLTS